MAKRTCAGEDRLSGARCYLPPRHEGRCNGWAHYPGQLVSWLPRRDKRRRIIGRNWWREMVTEQYHSARDAWLSKRESGEPIHTDAVPGATYDTAYYQLSDEEYKMVLPQPLFKDVLIANAGMGYAA